MEINLETDSVSLQEDGKNLISGYEIEGISILNDRIVLNFNVFWRDQNDDNDKTTFPYLYDMSHLCFNIKYCPDDNIENYIDNNDLISNTVIHGNSTKTLTNTYRKNGYKFAGWNLYSVETNKWRYCNRSTGDWKWCVEGTEPEGYEKGVYVEGVSVKQTVPAGTTVLFCAVWEATDKFYVSFDGNGATSGTMGNVEITYGVSTKLPANEFTKKTNGNDVAFVGWNPYSVETGKWYYTNSDGSVKGWYVEGEEPKGCSKKVYKDEASIKQSTNQGSHIIFFAAWNEFTIYYDSNGVLIKSAKILLPTVVNKGFSTPVKKYDTSCISIYEDNVPTSLNGYNQYLVESELWRYYSDTDSSIWLEESSNLPLYTYTYNSISNGLSAGRRVVFSADWLYA